MSDERRPPAAAPAAQTFPSLEAEAHHHLLRTAAAVEEALELLLKPLRLSPAQFNVLRVIRGAGPGGVGRNGIRSRLPSRMPDVTRLLERMEASGLVVRERSTSDRRFVPTRLTRKGLQLLEEAEALLAEAQRRQLGHLTTVELLTLVRLLGRVRDGGG